MTSPLRKALEQGSRGGVFFLWGEDEHRKGEAVKEIVDAHVDESTKDFNLDVVEGSVINVADLARIVATPPMMAEWRVVVVKGAEAFAGAARSRDLVLGLAASPPPDLALILTARIPGGSKAKYYSQLKKIAQSVEFPAISTTARPCSPLLMRGIMTPCAPPSR